MELRDTVLHEGRMRVQVRNRVIEIVLTNDIILLKPDQARLLSQYLLDASMQAEEQ